MIFRYILLAIVMSYIFKVVGYDNMSLVDSNCVILSSLIKFGFLEVILDESFKILIFSSLVQ